MNSSRVTFTGIDGKAISADIAATMITLSMNAIRSTSQLLV